MKKIVLYANFEIGQNQRISISFVGPRTIRQINKQFVKHFGPTDVISFDYRNDSYVQSDDVVVELIIHPNMAVLEAAKRKHSSFAYEITLYIVHGILHFSGENDLIPTERAKMRRKEKIIMNKLMKEFSLDLIFTNPIIIGKKNDS